MKRVDSGGCVEGLSSNMGKEFTCAFGGFGDTVLGGRRVGNGEPGLGGGIFLMAPYKVERARSLGTCV